MFEPSGFSLQIFKDRYALDENETWQEACQRVAYQAALAESATKVKKYEEMFLEEIVNNRFVPGGRIWYGAGRPHPSLLNCFVLSDNLDSKEGWGKLAYDMIVTSASGGGCGTNFTDVRPRGSIINGHKGTAPGSVELMKLINGIGDPIRAGGGRRVALMFALSLYHPDIMEFLDAKLVQGKLHNANISVLCNDTENFIKAIKGDKDLELNWKGKYKQTIKAKLLWDKIVQNAWQSAEPGFLNQELALSENTIYYIKNVVSTNPCGEIWLSPYESCCLGHLVLPRFVENGDVNWETLGKSISVGVRFLDNILSVNTYPLPEMKEVAQNLRRIGLGTTGLADMLVLLGYKYGSKSGNEFVDKLYRFISKQAYEASVMLAIEKGPFPLCKPEEHIKSGYVKRMTPKVKSYILEHGIRNCALLTIAPTGTVSILSDNCSSGIEPMFSPAYERRYWEEDKRKTEIVFHPLFKSFMDQEKDIKHFVCAAELNVEDHMEIQKIIQKHVDNAVSKTLTLSENYPIADMAKTWLEYLPYLKGVTFYRENSRNFVDDKGNKLEPPLKAIPLKEAMKLYTKEAKIAAVEHKCSGGKCDL